MKNVFVSFDLENTSNLYNDFYKKAKNIGLNQYIVEDSLLGGDILPNTTLHGMFDGNSDKIVDFVTIQLSNIFKELNVKGKSLVIVSETWGTKDH